jgi:ABC-type molybdate transport system substrate-binding protein
MAVKASMVRQYGGRWARSSIEFEKLIQSRVSRIFALCLSANVLLVGFGVVYATDAASDSSIEIAGVFPEDTHPPIIFPVALATASKNPAAAKFLAFIESAAAAPAFQKTRLHPSQHESVEAILVQSRNPPAVRFLDFLKSPATRTVFRKFGYVTLDRD